ncbi:MAG TPA: hypothetical protein VGD80_13980 [Kofleriaceae bacterium]
MSTLEKLLDAVKSQIATHVQQGNHTGFDTGGLLGKITDLFGEHKRATGGPGNARPASEDPYGDPADEVRGHAARPASQDPYGDPADEVGRRH